MQTSLSTYSGPEFLLFYTIAMVAAVIAGLWLPRFLRADGRERPVTDRLELAWLAGRSGRVTETVLAGLLSVGALAGAGSHKLRRVGAGFGRDRAERAILGLSSDFGITEAHKTLKPAIAEVEDRLVGDGLALSSGERWSMRFASVSPYLMVLALGWYRRTAGIADGKPVGYLTVLMVVLGVLALFRFGLLDPRTRAGQEAVAEARDRSIRLKSAPTQPELGMGVALFGTAVLVGTPFSELHAMRQAAVGDGAGGYSSDTSSSGSDGGSGGCGGGGCGGCGG